MFKLLYLVLLASLYETNAYKILVVFPMPSKSHSILGDAVAEVLSRAGHEVTYIAIFVPENPPPNVTIVDISENLKSFPRDGPMDLKAFMDNKEETNNFLTYVPLLMNISRLTVEHPKVQKLMADKNQEFDVVITEWMFSEIYAGFAGVFNCPLIWFSSLPPHWMVFQLIDEISNPAYTIDIFSDSTPPLTFKQRFNELCSQIMGKFIQIFWISGIENELYNQFFVPIIRKRRNSVPFLETLRYNSSLVLSNSHVSMNIPTRLPPNFIPIGGFHVNPKEPLPQELQELMDNAKHGVIYFSMGSNLKSKHFPDTVKQDLVKMFSKLKQIVLWKFEEDLPNTPSNVRIFKWMPQQSILGHKNCVLFITHGGLLSSTETLHFGVPTIGIPVYGDQFINVERSVKKGFAKKVDLSYNLAADLQIAIEDILGHPEYAARMKELSAIYHDRPVPPAKELVHWVEHVVRTKGALHLRSPALLVPWYQKLYLDLILALLIVFLVLKHMVLIIKHKVLRRRKEKIN